MEQSKNIDGHSIDEMQLYYKGICKHCKANGN